MAQEAPSLLGLSTECMLLRAAELLWNASRPVMSRVLPTRWDQRLIRWRKRRLPRTQTAGSERVVQSLRPCDELNCIFVHIPKAAGISVTRALFGCGVGHRSVSYYRDVFDEDFQKYFKFTVVRNPFSRIVSAYEFLRQGGHPAWPGGRRYRDEVLSKYKGFEGFVLRELEQATEEQIHFRPQVNFLTLDGELAVNYVARLETLDQDFEAVCEHLEVDVELPKKNETGDDRPPLTSYYEREEVANTVRRVYAEDFSMLDYSTEVPGDESPSNSS